MDCPIIDYESNNRKYELIASEVSRNYSFGDAGFVEMKFPITIRDRAINMIYAVVTYKILSTSFERYVSCVDKIDKNKDTIDYIVNTYGCFIEPELPEEGLVLKLLDLLVKYFEETDMVKNFV